MKKLFLTTFLFFNTLTFSFAEHFTKRAEMTIDGLVCDFCARALEKTFSKKEEVKNIDVNLDTGLITVFFAKGKTLDNETLKQSVLDAGYNLKIITRIDDADQ